MAKSSSVSGPRFMTQFDRSKKVSLDTRCDSDGVAYELRTRQEFKKECDINEIVARSLRTGILGDPARQALARYGDISQVPDFQEMNNRILAAREAFMSFPAKFREAFDNDPQLFLKGLQTQEGQELMVKFGLASKVDPKAKEKADKASPVTRADIQELAQSIASTQRVKKQSKKISEGRERYIPRQKEEEIE